MTRDLLRVGAGVLGRETLKAVRAINTVTPTWNLRGFVDDDPARHSELVGGVREPAARMRCGRCWAHW